MQETITLNSKEQKRLMVLNQVLRGQLTGKQASELLEMSLRQVRRMLAAYKKEGAAALSHGNKGRSPHNKLAESVLGMVVELARSKYEGCNQQQMSELLAEREGIYVSRSSLHRTLKRAGVPSSRKRRPPEHRSRRARYPQEGMLLQIDASPHDWLQNRGPRLCLLAAIDDATGHIAGALFRQQEDAQGYMLLMKQVVMRYGRPQAVYRDRHSIFEHTPKRLVECSLEEQLEGEQAPTQFGRMLQELEITSIRAYSPQAKGRVERLFGTLQSRLVTELRLAGACTQEEANRLLAEYLPRFNTRFGVPPLQEGSAYRPLSGPEEHASDQAEWVESIICMKYQRTVGVDNVVKLGEHRLQLLPDEHRRSYARTKVEVQERLDGSLAVYYQQRCLLTQPATVEAPTLRTRKGRSLIGQSPTPAQSHIQVSAPVEPAAVIPAHTPAKTAKHPWRRYPDKTRSDIFPEQLR